MFESFDLFQNMYSNYALRLIVAAVCGGLLGMERERKDKAAGLRTVILISVGAALFMIVSDLIAVVTLGPEEITRVDPSRIASQVVTGVGFLGGGAIIQSRGAIHGLTTAAVIWTAAGIGLCIGLGYNAMGVVVTIFVVAMLVTLDPVRDWFGRFGTPHELELVVPNDTLVLQRVENTLRQYDGNEAHVHIEASSDDMLQIRIQYRMGESTSHRFVDALARIEKVRGTRHR